MPTYEVVNRNFQSPLNFEFRVDRLTDFNYFVQKINLPDLSITPASNGGTNPLVKIPIPGDSIDFGELSIDFKVDEGMNNWYEIYAWMRGISFPEDNQQYRDWLAGRTTNLNGVPLSSTLNMNSVHGTGTFLINTSQNNPCLKITFVDMHPVSLGEIVFDTRETDVLYVTASVSFKYSYFLVEKIVQPTTSV
jgi:hypothetical protein